MQYRLVALTALAACASAQQSSGNSSAEQLASVVSVLETALPSSLYSAAITNPAAVSSEIVSEFAAGSTPGWYSSLPSDVKTFLVPSGAGIVNSANGTRPISTGTPGNLTGGSNSTASRSGSGSGTTVTSTQSGGSGSGSGSESGSGSASGGSGSSGSQASSSSSRAGAAAASLPTNIMGLGLAGAVGLVGVLAL